MKQGTLVIPSKLSPPHLRLELLRPRLTALGLGNTSKKIMTITAGPGYGKTTLMAQIGKSRIGESMWYQIDAMDTDPMVFLRHLVYGVSGAAGIKVAMSKQRLEDIEDIQSEGEQIAELLCKEISEELLNPLTICFDDCHLLGDKCAISILEKLLGHQPRELFVILSSRYKLPFPMGKFRSAGVLQEVRRGDLRFSPGEMSELLVDTWGLKPPADVIEQLYERLDGWPGGLVLMEAHIRVHNSIPKLITNHRVRRNIYGYLAEEVLGGQPEEFRDLLMHCAIVDPVDPQVAGEVIGNSETAKLLAKAEKLNLFISRIKKTRLYRFHPMFRSFLLHSLNEKKGPSFVNQLHVRYGTQLEENGEWAGAIEQFIQAGRSERALPLLEAHGSEMFTDGEHLTLSRWLDAIGANNLTPTLFMFLGRINMLLGLTEDALEILRAIEAKLVEPEQLSECSLAIAECLGDLGQWQEGIEELQKIEKEIISDDLIFEATFQLGGLYFAGYDNEGLRACCAEAQEQIKGQFEPKKRNRLRYMVAMQNMRKGNFKKSYELLTSHTDIAEIHGVQRASHVNTIANCLLLSADYPEAKETANECMEITESLNQKMWLAPIYDTLGCIEFGLGHRELALNLIEKSLLTTIGKSNNAEAIAHCHKGTILRWTGYYDDALDNHMNAERIAKEKHEVYDEVISQVNIAADLVFLERYESAKQKFIEAEVRASNHEFGYASTKINFHHAWLAHITNQRKMTLELLRKSLRSARLNKQNHFIVQEGRSVLELFSIALENGIETDYVSWVLKMIGVRSLSVVKPLLQENDYRLRLMAVNIIDSIGDVKALTMLRVVSRDKDERVQGAARAAQKKLRGKIETPIKHITDRELQIVELLTTGAPNSAIAKELFISEQTVKTHMTNIMRKMGLNSRLEIVLYYKDKLQE